MIREFIYTRCRKLVRKAAKGEKPPPDALTNEKERIFIGVYTFSGVFQNLTKVVQGRRPRVKNEQEHKRAVLRFVEPVHAIVGVDMKPYSPFQAEDVASLPLHNADSDQEEAGEEN
jgi:hypothetical protein